MSSFGNNYFIFGKCQFCVSDGMGWERLAGTGVATAQKIVQRPTPFLTRHSASWLGGVTPMNNLPHDHVHTDEYTQTGATLSLKKRNKNARSRGVPVIGPIETWYLGKSRKSPVQQTQSITVYLQKWGHDVAA